MASRKLNSTGTDLTYDTLGRLSQLTFPIGDFDYTYVGTTGRRATVTYPNSQTTTYSYLDDEHDYTYDANGNLTADGTKTYLWNARNQLVEVKAGSTTIATFAYDGDGRRTQKVAAGLTHVYVYDAEDIIEERITGTSSDTIRYYHGAGIDEPLARKNSSGTVTYYLADHLGSIVQETSSSGSVTLDREYDPWGKLLDGTATSGYAFTGREFDSETGLVYYRARYRTDGGNFLSEDSDRFQASNNWYSYAANRPEFYVDPSGHDVTVAFYKGGPYNPFGHVGLAVNSSATKGFYPRGDTVYGPGEVRSDEPTHLVDSFVIHTTPEQDDAIQRALDETAHSPGQYSFPGIMGQNCTTTVIDILKKGGLVVPKNAQVIAPAKFYSDLRRFYAK